jgi:AraC family transcriptional regulator
MNLPRVHPIIEAGDATDFRVRVVEYPPNFWQPVHTHNYSSITVVLRGAIEETHSGCSEYATPLSLVIKASDVTHSDRYGPRGCKTLQIRLPAAALKEFACPVKSIFWHQQGGPAVRECLSFLELLNDPLDVNLGEFEFMLSDVFAALGEQQVLQEKAPHWLLRVKELLDETEPCHTLTLKSLSAEAGVHPVHLTRQFKRRYGCSIRKYLKHRRVRAAAALVVDESVSLTDIAHRLGYADQPHFCRDFRSFAHLTPNAYRRLLQRIDFRTG